MRRAAGEAPVRAAAPAADRGASTVSVAPQMTPRYHINLFWSEADSAWVADVPDLQSCSAFGDTPSEALPEVEKASPARMG